MSHKIKINNEGIFLYQGGTIPLLLLYFQLQNVVKNANSSGWKMTIYFSSVLILCDNKSEFAFYGV